MGTVLCVCVCVCVLEYVCVLQRLLSKFRLGKVCFKKQKSELDMEEL